MSDTATATPTTESVVLDMLRENTGRHMLDSGGAYGRHWEKNQAVDFDALPSTTLSFKYGVEVTHYLHAWLPERLSYEQAGDDAFNEWAAARDNEAWLQSAELWVEILGGTGLYGDGKPLVVNTYNGEDLLSQTLQYVYFSLERETALPAPGSEEADRASTCVCEDGWTESGVQCSRCEGEGVVYNEDLVLLGAGTYALVQIHGGADVRGGYTRPRLFALDDETGLLDNARATISCSEDRDHYWSTDDTCNWYAEGSAGYGAGTQLEDYDRVEASTGDLPPAEERVGKLVIDTDTDTGYCPLCGVGTLSAGW